jgi:chromosome segregation ATPase
MSSSFVERLKKLEDERDKLKAEITEKVERSHSETSEKMKRLEEVIVGRLKLDISKHAGHISSELSSEVGEKMRKEEDIVRKYLKELEKGEGQISALIKRDESEVRKQIQQIVKEEAGSAAKVAEFRKEFDAARKHLDSTMKQLERISRQYEQIKNEPESYDQLFKDVMELKRNVDEESSLRVSADKTIQGIERKLNEMGEGLGKLKELEKLDYTKVLQAVRTREEINQKMMEQVKAEAAGVATRYLDEFAKTLDRKLPNLATKDHIAQLDARLEQIIDKKVRAVRPAVVNPLLERRVESMERTVRELMFVLQELNRQKPFVVE